MKTVLEWLNELPEVARDKAVTNMEPASADVKVSYLSIALVVAFNWEGSPEGRNYWGYLHTEIFYTEADAN